MPKSLLEKEAEHVEGFNPQVAWVTHAGGKELDEPLAIRPTSEAIIADSVKDWIQSYRDLPLLMNLWNNVVRWELRTRLFLRTAEFLWQEAHTFHATEQEAADEVATGLEAYRAVAEDWLAIPVIRGRKSPAETFPGAIYTHAIEAMMRDTKALQAGTSHMLGQNFSRAAGIEFLDRDNLRKNPWGTSWGFSTRMVGATIMAHGDDSGPGAAAQRRAHAAGHRAHLPDGGGPRRGRRRRSSAWRRSLATVQTASGPLRYKVDWRDESPGFKFNHWELRGVPLRLEIGPRDVAAGQAVIVRRIDRAKETHRARCHRGRPAGSPGRLPGGGLPACARLPDREHAHVDTYDDFKAVVEGPGGFLMAPWCGSAECEQQINADTGATIRCIPFDSPDEPGACLVDGKPSERRVLFARAY